jgi:hypothetical protein
MSVLNLTTAKTFRQYAAVEGVNHPPIHPAFEHARPNNDAISPAGVLVDGVVVPPVFTADAGTDLLHAPGHGLVADTPIQVSNTGGALPGGLAVVTTVYVIASGLTADDFKVSATLGGSAINITSAGTGTHSWSRYLTADEQGEASRWLLDHLDDHVALPVVRLWIAAQLAYEASTQHKAWIIDDYLQRQHQWTWRSADHIEAAQNVSPPSSSTTGDVTDPPDDTPIPRGSL